jgi:hypothetical protein
MGYFMPTVSSFPARVLSLRRRGGSWRCKRKLPKPGSYSKPSWLQYFRRQQPPGPNRRRRRSPYWTLKIRVVRSAVTSGYYYPSGTGCMIEERNPQILSLTESASWSTTTNLVNSKQRLCHEWSGSARFPAVELKFRFGYWADRKILRICG